MKTRYLLILFALGLGLALVWILGGGNTPIAAAPVLPVASAAEGSADVPSVAEGPRAEGHTEAPHAPAAELQVCPSGCAYSSIQDAVDAANDGDVIKVAAGTYTDVHARPRNHITTTGTVTQVVYVSKTVAIQGGYTITNWMVSDPDVNPTTLDAQRRGRVFYITAPAPGAGISPTIEGLRITGGDSAPGGGVYAITATVTISGCRVTGNTANRFLPFGGAGGGVYLLSGNNSTLTGNWIQSNDAQAGGGTYLDASDSVLLSGNTIQGNAARGFYGAAGGGIVLSDSPNATLSSNSILNNTAQAGGGVLLDDSDNITLRGNTILSNTAMGSHTFSEGGGILLRSSGDVTLSGNTIRGNSGSAGTGVSIWSSENARLDNNVIADNQVWWGGSAVFVEGSTVSLRHTTLARNGGSGLFVGPGDAHSTVVLTNTVLVSHTVGITVTGGSTATLNGILWYENETNTGGPGTLTVTHQITGSPAFAADGYHITSASAALDAGVDAGVSTDIDGEPRPVGAGCDIGADEVALLVTKRATPDPVQPGAALTYTIRVTNATGIPLHATIIDTLPLSVTLDEASGGTLILPGGTLAPPDGTVVLPDGRVAVTWTSVITAPGGLWMGAILVTVDEGYAGPLINLVEVTTEEGVMGKAHAFVNAHKVYLPLVLR